jgi:ParB family chromosome partitioning protein
MNPKQTREEIRMIPIDKIDVLNPRDRNTKAFKVIVGNIKDIGLKKPIKVTPRTTDAGEQRYVLVFGEGRLTAFRNLGEKEIPAIVVEISDEDAFLMSLVENIARRQEKPLENLASITALRAKGHSPKEIATKIGMTPHYVQGMLTLLEEGEERLVVGVERGQIPLNVALTIHGAGNDDKSVQAALQDAYESGKLRGKPLMDVRRLLEKRRTLGRSANKQGPASAPRFPRTHWCAPTSVRSSGSGNWSGRRNTPSTA